jgi:cobalt-zinc-cadmium efflux system outer membrane protein
VRAKRALTIAAGLCALASGAHGQTPPPQASPPAQQPPPAGAATHFTFRGYMSEVGRGNLDLVAQRASVSIAEAQIGVAQVFPDPTLTAGLMQYDVTRKGNPTATIVALGVPLEIGGQRGARVAAAEASLGAVRADLLDFLRGLRATAADSYIEALHVRAVLERRRLTLASLQRLVAVNQERNKAGDIGEVALIQSRVEAEQFRADLLAAEGDVRAADIALVSLLGSAAVPQLDRTLQVDGDLRVAVNRHFDVATLVRTALTQRPDLIAARRRLAASERQIDLAQANRVIGLNVGATWQHNFEVTQPPLPASDFLGATLTVPLPFSRMYRGELDAAYAGRRQADATARSVNIRVEAEVREAVARYDAAAARVRLYASGVLADADSVLEKTLYNYQRGGATLTEVLVAQRTDNEVYLSYFDSLAEAAHALVAVEQASGAWDLDL